MSKLRGRIIDELPSALRELYSSAGYSCYRTVGFEEYDLFSQYRDFLTSGQMITFTGAGGRLLALKPDITMSIIRDAAEEISDHFAKSEIIISFATRGTDFPVAGGRVYIPDVDGSQVERFASAYGESETVRELVFMANSKDARFEKYAVLRPLMSES